MVATIKLVIKDAKGILQAQSATHLRRPEIQVSQRRQLDEFFRTLTRHLRESEAETLEVAERAGTEHLREISIC